MKTRIEKDLIGELKIENDKYYGINTVRALENFSYNREKVSFSLIKSLVLIKKAAAYVNKTLRFLPEDKSEAIINACDDILDEKYIDQFPLPALQGGAGTSTNMNVNEVIANIAIEKLGGNKGDYHIIDPNDDVNKFQSTNDVYPTAVKLTCIQGLLELSYTLADLQDSFQKKEKEFAHILKVGRTQLQDALPITLGQEFGAYSQAIQRDRWRVYKSEERLRQVNLGGTAIGTGTNAPKMFVYKFIEKVRELSGIGLARAENSVDLTQNNDAFVEVSGILKAVSINLIKISSDLRLLSSGPFSGIGEIKLPSRQAGSSIMPGKVNPVIAEYAGMAGMQVVANDLAITQGCANGQLELNVWLPLIAYNIINSIDILSDVSRSFKDHCIDGITPCEERCKHYLERSFVNITLLVPYIGYKKATELVEYALSEKITLKEAVIKKEIFTEEELLKIFNPKRATSPGISGAEFFKDKIKIKRY